MYVMGACSVIDYHTLNRMRWICIAMDACSVMDYLGGDYMGWVNGKVLHWNKVLCFGPNVDTSIKIKYTLNTQQGSKLGNSLTLHRNQTGIAFLNGIFYFVSSTV